MPIRRIALIFDSVQRPETTGVYCHRALGRLVEVTHFQPGDLDRVPRDGFDLYLNIDDGLRYHLPAALRPTRVVGHRHAHGLRVVSSKGARL